ncbi:hypothetical protein HKX48_009552 [Thoreauomyces humboldtii]|nr:hypothetical protein HKX48_009552 [Thoreauomyces humboldtii]
MARIGIIGAGNVGLYVGAFLHLAGCQITWVGRSWILEEIESAGSLTVSDFHERMLSIDADELSFLTELDDLVRDPELAIDVLLIACKAHATEETVKRIRHLDGKVVVVTLQNGLHNADVIRREMPGTKVVAGMLPTNIVHLPGAHFHQATVGPILLEDCEEASTFAQLLISAGLPTQLTPDIRSILHGKLVINLMNATNALSGLSLRAQLSERSHRTVLAVCVDEALAVYAAANVTAKAFFAVPLWLVPYVLRLPNWLFQQTATQFVGMDGRAMSSMYEDLLLKRPTEIDQLNGEIIAMGKEHGVPTPYNCEVVRLIKAIEKEKPLHPPSLGGDELLAEVSGGESS